MLAAGSWSRPNCPQVLVGVEVLLESVLYFATLNKWLGSEDPQGRSPELFPAGAVTPRERMMNQTATPADSFRGSQKFTALRVAEKVAIAFFAYALIASWFFSVSLAERAAILLLNATVVGVLLLLSCSGHPGRSAFLAPLRDWLPCALIVLAYRESGLFLVPDLSHRLDQLFIVWDRALLGSAWFQNFVALSTPWFERYMEFAYLLVYPFVPLGFAGVYFVRSGLGEAARAGTPRASASADRYWTAVLLAVLSSYAIFPFFPLTPPRVLFHDLPAPASWAGAASAPLLRKLNFWILDRYSVQACIFPSGHVAGAVATALAVRAEHRRLGSVFLFVAASIAASTVFGRYHYTADALAGALVGIVAYAMSKRLCSRSSDATR